MAFNNKGFSPETLKGLALTELQDAVLVLQQVTGTPSGAPTGGAITEDDNGATITNSGAAGATLHDLSVGLPEGFEVRLIQVAGFDMTVKPPGGERFSVSIGTGLVGQGLVIEDAKVQSITIKKIGSLWIQVSGALTNASYAALQLAVRDLPANGINGADQLLTPSTSTAFTIRLVQESTPNDTLGTEDETGAYADGVSFTSPEPVYLEIEEESGVGSVIWNAETGFALSFSYAAVGDSNKEVTGATTGAKAFGPPGTNTIVVPASRTDTFWIDTSGNMYERSQGAGPVTSFADAVLAGRI